MSNLIAAVDFSDCSINALEHAVSIANRGLLDLHMVWVNNPSVTKTTIYSDTSSDLIDQIKGQFAKLIEKYKPRLPESEIDYVIREGKVYREIIDEAKEMNSICIVMGTHGASGFEQFWIGSNANRLISVSHCPVITLRSGISIKHDLERIVMPLDSTLDTRQKVPFTAYLAKLFEAEIHILKLYSNKVKAVQHTIDEYAEQVIQYLDEEEISYVLDSVQADNLTVATIDYAEKVKANLISIMTEQETKMYNLLIGPYAQQMVNTSPFPVLSINPKETLIMASH
ncbi:MAG TPA: universal stress protein [Bacteroidales bacterium]|nr:universal stress protein [Bacteroidales bacterium]HPT03044.1 universal stress protein [Bacteroidales bacterium]